MSINTALINSIRAHPFYRIPHALKVNAADLNVQNGPFFRTHF